MESLLGKHLDLSGPSSHSEQLGDGPFSTPAKTPGVSSLSPPREELHEHITTPERVKKRKSLDWSMSGTAQVFYWKYCGEVI